MTTSSDAGATGAGAAAASGETAAASGETAAASGETAAASGETAASTAAGPVATAGPEPAAKPAKGILYVVGIGPGARDHATPAALAAIADAEVIVGYTTYIHLVRSLIVGKEVIRTGMTEEIGRARAAVERARAGGKVALVSSGDAGIYGMAGLVFEVLRTIGWKRGESPELRIVPGMTALSSCGSLVGAPLAHDFCAISLSDLLTPWPVIARRIEAAASADFVIGLYNPASGRRTRQIVEAQATIRRYRSGDTPVALVKSAYRKLQTAVVTDLDHLLDYEIGMLTTVLVGSSQTFVFEGYMVTPRGYTNKYSADGAVHDGQRPGYSLVIGDAARAAAGPNPGALGDDDTRDAEASRERTDASLGDVMGAAAGASFGAAPGAVARKPLGEAAGESSDEDTRASLDGSAGGASADDAGEPRGDSADSSDDATGEFPGREVA